MKLLPIRFNAPKVDAKISTLIDNTKMSGIATLNKSQIARAAMNIGLAKIADSANNMTISELSRYIDGEQ